MKIQKMFWTIIALLSSITGVAADDITGSDVFEMGEIVVTPSRFEQSYGDVGVSMNIITRDQIQSGNTQDVSQVLDNLPGVAIMDYGSAGSQKNIRLRGLEDEQVLIMVDGRPVNDPRAGDTDLNNIAVENIERIEVIRGPGASLYGTSACGGVINIITRTAPEETSTVLNSRIGSFRTWSNRLAHGAQCGQIDYFITFDQRESEGHRDNSDYSANNLTARLGWEPDEKQKFILDTGTYESEKGLPGTISSPDLNDRQEDDQNYLSLTYENRLSSISDIRIKGYQNVDRMRFIESLTPLNHNTHQSKVRGIDIQYTRTLGDDYHVVLGIDSKNNRLNSSASGKHSYTVKALYLLGKYDPAGPWSVEASARADDYSSFGTELSPGINVVYNFNKSVKLHGLVARCFRAPTFNELYWPATSWAEGNPALQPEEGISAEIGLDGNVSNKFIWGLTYFRNDFDDLIDWAAGNDGIWRPANVSSALSEGIECETKAYLGKSFETDFNYTYTRAKDEEADKYRTYWPKHKFSSGISYKNTHGTKLHLTGQYVTKRFTNTSNTDHLDDYFTAGLDLQQKLRKDLKVFISLDNIFNRKYQRVKGYPLPGFSVMSGLEWEF